MNMKTYFGRKLGAETSLPGEGDLRGGFEHGALARRLVAADHELRQVHGGTEANPSELIHYL